MPKVHIIDAPIHTCIAIRISPPPMRGIVAEWLVAVSQFDTRAERKINSMPIGPLRRKGSLR
jgi:hypothetical protein